MAETGRPPMYKSVEEMQAKIDAYFEECEGTVLTREGEVVVDKYGEPVMVGRKPMTITGLALALGFNSRQSLLNYQDKEEFMDTITRAKTKVEQYAEERLFDKDGANGAKFSLANNFTGWKEKVETDINTKNNIVIELVDE